MRPVTHWQLFKMCIKDDPVGLKRLLRKTWPDYMKTISMLDVAIENNSQNVVRWLADRPETTDEDLKYGIARAKFYKNTKIAGLLLSCRICRATIEELEKLKRADGTEETETKT
jgi:hypothetical protein